MFLEDSKNAKNFNFVAKSDSYEHVRCIIEAQGQKASLSHVAIAVFLFLWEKFYLLRLVKSAFKQICEK